MIRLLAASAVLLAFAVASSEGAQARCDEDCSEAAYERAEAREYAREEAEDEGRGGDGPRSLVPAERTSVQQERSAKEKQKRAEAAAAAARRPAQSRSAGRSRVERPETAPSQAAPSEAAPSKAVNESSSIATAIASQVDEVDRTEQRVGSGQPLLCKEYFASAGVTLSVRCD